MLIFFFRSRIPQGGGKLGASIVRARKCGRLIQLVRQCEHTQQHALSRESMGMPLQENFANLAL